MQSFDPNSPSSQKLIHEDVVRIKDNLNSLRSREAGPNTPFNPIPGRLWADTSGNIPSGAPNADDVIVRMRNKANNTDFTISFTPTTSMLFKQSFAPIGWLIDDSFRTNSAIRCVQEATYEADGGQEQISTDKTDTMVEDTGAEHTHGLTGNTSTAPNTFQADGNTGMTDGPLVNAHSHSLTAVVSGTASHVHRISLMYIDTIVAILQNNLD